MSASSALVLFSGGQDSATCLADALSRFDHVETLGFDYGQRHLIELQVRLDFLRELRAQFPHLAAHLGEDHVLELGVLGQLSDTALTREVAITMTQGCLPSTFVPGRNLIFLNFAAALAYRRGIRHIILGVCETDYSGYPDCRDDTIKAMQIALNLGMDKRFIIETPLMWRDKAATWQLARELGGEALVALIRDQTHSCYLGDRSLQHVWGFGCGTCPACQLRGEGWRRFASRAV